MGEQPIRYCRYCSLILDKNAPQHGEMIARNVAGKRERRVQPHCESPVCTWCWGCRNRRVAAFAAGVNPESGDPIIPPEQMT